MPKQYLQIFHSAQMSAVEHLTLLVAQQKSAWRALTCSTRTQLWLALRFDDLL